MGAGHAAIQLEISVLPKHQPSVGFCFILESGSVNLFCGDNI